MKRKKGKNWSEWRVRVNEEMAENKIYNQNSKTTKRKGRKRKMHKNDMAF